MNWSEWWQNHYCSFFLYLFLYSITLDTQHWDLRVFCHDRIDQIHIFSMTTLRASRSSGLDFLRGYFSQPLSNLKSHQLCQMSSVLELHQQGDFSKQFLIVSVLPRSSSVTLTKKGDWLLYQQSVKHDSSLCKCIFLSYRHELKQTDVWEVENQSKSIFYIVFHCTWFVVNGQKHEQPPVLPFKQKLESMTLK